MSNFYLLNAGNQCTCIWGNRSVTARERQAETITSGFATVEKCCFKLSCTPLSTSKALFPADRHFTSLHSLIWFLAVTRSQLMCLLTEERLFSDPTHTNDWTINARPRPQLQLISIALFIIPSPWRQSLRHWKKSPSELVFIQLLCACRSHPTHAHRIFGLASQTISPPPLPWPSP